MANLIACCRCGIIAYHAQSAMLEPVVIVRISKGRYTSELHALVTARLAESSGSLVPVIRALPGCLAYYAGSDEASCTMVNVSVWDTMEHANAMASLPEMAALAKEFVAIGVEFERPIINYPTLWHLGGS
ncbi:MAG: antibiotic biosynthesis monooxygenase [Meiothermus sp.]|nr:antibiotic biosynthesis monooxygenase [Meiothermus sp.]